MKNQLLLFVIALSMVTACSKDNDELLVQNQQLEQRGNDNHKIWKLSKVTALWDYTLSNGFMSNGIQSSQFVYGCSRPVGRPFSAKDYLEENDVIYADNSATFSFNNNFMIATESAIEYGDEVVRTYQYDSDNKWTGITTEVNGEIIDDEIEIGPGGQVKSYTHDGVRTVYEWKADNVSKVKTYVQASAITSLVKNSLVFKQLGIDINSRNKAKEQILLSYHKLQKSFRTSSHLRSNNSDEWLLVFVEEQTVDRNIIQPFTSTKAGFPGTSSYGGYLYLPKNYIIEFKGYSINEDGSLGDLAYRYNNYTQTTRDNLPVNVKFSNFVADYEADASGNLLDYTDNGSFVYEYISGCNQKPN